MTIPRRVLTLLTLLLLSQRLVAQNVDVFAGYSHLHGSGWEASATLNFTPHFGLTTDFGGYYGFLQKTAHTFLAGPRFRTPYKNGSFFAHALFGYEKLTYPQHSFAVAIGGGYDWNLSPRFSFRVLQVEDVITNLSFRTQNTARISSGLVFRFPKRSANK